MDRLPVLLVLASLAVGAAPSGEDWPTFGRGTDRNARVDEDGPDRRPLSVTWRFAAPGAIPLDGPPLNGDLKTSAYAIGLPVGPSLSHGLVLAGTDSGEVEALDVLTGARVWSRRLWNMAMVNPVVVGDTIYATTGNPFFNFAETLRFAAGERAVRGPGLNGLYALELRTGMERWHVYLKGEAMPTPAVADGVVYLAAGDGYAYAVDAKSGKAVWRSDVEAIDGMSSPLVSEGRIFFGGSHPDLFLALEAKTGRILWKRAFADPTPAGFGAATAALGAGHVLVEELVKTGDASAPTANRLFALDPATGRSVWERELGRGKPPEGFATGTPVVVDGVVYASSIVDGMVHALSAGDGRSLWSARARGAGAGLVVGERAVFVAAGPRIVELDRKDGRRLGAMLLGGNLGPAAPLLAGETLICDNLYGWVIAVPVPR